MPPPTSRQYIVRDASIDAASTGFSSLHLSSTPTPVPGETEVLIRIHAVSLNFRDIMVATGTYMWPVKSSCVPCSDGAGEIVAIGAKVTRFQVGDKVAATFFQTEKAVPGSLGADIDGVLREYAAVHESGVVKVPEHLSMEEASALPCAGVTAWNALYGGGKALRAGDAVVTQGSGGVSLVALQFAVAAGAMVVATTSSVEKAERLKGLGAHEVINYRETPSWGPVARGMTNDGQGADFVIEIGGPETIEESLKAVNVAGTVAVIGQRTDQAGGNAEQGMKLTDAFMYPTTMRRILVGSREQFEEMNRAIAVNKIRPAIDEKVFAFEDAPKAFEYLYQQKHVGNVVVKVV